MLPADVANRQAWRHAIYNGACNLTLPMKQLWLADIMDAILVLFVIPFVMFYYEGDQDKPVMKRMKSSLKWVISTAVICALLLGILYDDFWVRWILLLGAFPRQRWPSRPHGTSPVVNNVLVLMLDRLCSVYSASAASETTWTMRTTFPEYIVALAMVAGSVLFTIFGGVGIACLPLGLITAFIRRQKTVITRSQYIKEANELAKRARELVKAGDGLRQEERNGNKGRRWRKNVKSVETELLFLEEDVKALEEVYPQGEQAEATWALTILGHLAKLVLGVLGYVDCFSGLDCIYSDMLAN
ncbi:hypothetical protein OROHE_005950 [Orobanche hederae]